MDKWEKTRMIGGWVTALIELITESVRAARVRRQEKRERRRERRKKKKKAADKTQPVWRPAHEGTDRNNRDYKTF